MILTLKTTPKFRMNINNFLNKRNINEWFIEKFFIHPNCIYCFWSGRCWDSCKKTTHWNNYVVKCHAPQCRHAYGVSRKGAEKIIRLTQPLINAGDATISKYIQTGQIIAYAPTKSFFFQNRQQLGSNLNNLSIQKECV